MNLERLGKNSVRLTGVSIPAGAQLVLSDLGLPPEASAEAVEVILVATSAGAGPLRVRVGEAGPPYSITLTNEDPVNSSADFEVYAVFSHGVVS